MKLIITIKLDSAAFDDGNGTEVARILRELANEITDTTLEAGDSQGLRDINGNRVGTAEVR